MRLLHGSNVEIKKIDLNLCKGNNDFGKGFYLTPSWQRAWEMGRRTKDKRGGQIIVNAYIFNPSQAKGLKIQTFKGFSVDWARFIIKNRESKGLTHDYDIVIGPVADAVVDQEIAQHKKVYGSQYLLEANLIKLVHRINQFGMNYIQYCFCTEAALNLLYKD
ncbi:MAG: DUF3990 domain-containing protein [Bacteroidales bacterium]|nr:DUF3990 domain-containing protein [Bacteroidales bacterium]